MKKIKSLVKNKTKLFDALQWAIIAVLAFTAVLMVLSSFDTPLKIRTFSVNSGSMNPKIPLGNLVVVRPREAYSKGDIITFTGRNKTMTTTHRIVDVSEDLDLGKVTYRTKGDANEDPDTVLVRKEQVIGKVLFSIPLLGFLVAFAKTQIGFTLLIVIPTTLIVYTELKNVKNEVSVIIQERKVAKIKPKPTPLRAATPLSRVKGALSGRKGSLNGSKKTAPKNSRGRKKEAGKKS